MQWTDERKDRLRAQWGQVSVRKIADAEQTSTGSVYRMARQLGLKTKERKYPAALQRDHRALRERSTRYPKSVISAKKSPRVLIDGGQSRKLGRRVTKGRWAGLAIYSLTLPERDTCPSTCREWASCYGNGMHWTRRHVLDAELVKRLDVELDMLAATHPGGFLVRLHVLGDFGRGPADGLPYVAFWTAKMREIPEIHVFGFTAHDPVSPVGQAIMALNREFPERCRLRFSGIVSDDGFGATVIERLADSTHVVCPFETDHPKAPKDCGSCGLCWTMRSTVEFVRH